LSEEDILRKITEKFGESVLEARVLGRRRISILVPPDAYKNVVKYVAQDLGLEFLSCLSGVDYGDSLEVVAHLGFSTQIPH
jgi:NADH:ubiquinone oxidoreductase subunit C